MKSPFQIERDAWGRLVLTDADGARFVGVLVGHAFPFTDPDRWISIRDAQGQELTLIDNPASLPDAVWRLMAEELKRREFVPAVRRIVRVVGETDPCEWFVETDRGATRFLLNSEEDVRRLGPYRRLIVDSHGIRYLVPDMRELDAASRKILERYL